MATNKNFEVKNGLSIAGTERISSAGVGTFTDLNVTGTTTTIDTATLQVQDKNIVINYGSGDTSSTASGAGITIQDAVNSSTDATLLWDASADEFDFSHTVTAPTLTIAGAATFDTSTLVVDATNDRVGIGTASPDTMLDISHARSGTRPTISAGTRLLIESTANISAFTAMSILGGNSSGASQINLGDVNDENVGQIGYYHADNSMRFVVNANERVRIDSSGNVGIGTTLPNDKFHVANGSTGAGYLRIANNEGYARLGTDGGELLLDVDGTERLRIDSSGNVGIGDTSPDKKLHITDTSGNHLRLAYNDSYYWDIGRQAADGRLSFTDVSGGEVLTLKTDGNVGIGVSSPSTMLHMNGTGDMIRLESTNSGAGGAQIDLIHFSPSPADNDVHGVINFGGYYSGSSSAYGSSIKSVWSNVGGKEAKLEFYTRDDAEFAARMVIDKDGNVGIGASSPSDKLEVSGTGGTRLKVTNTDTNWAGLDLQSGGNQANYIFFKDDSAERARITVYDSNDISFSTGNSPSEKMRILSSGDITFKCGDGTPSSSVVGWRYNSADSAYPWVKSSVGGSGGLTHYQFYNTNGAVGQIFTSGSGTTFATSSDYRLKENVDYTWDATTRLKQLKPARFNFKVDADTIVDGFLAHEVQNIVPEAIYGVKDGVDKNGEPDYQGIDHSKLVPLLVKTIQELEARIATLEG